MTRFLKEAILLIFVLVPYCYLIAIWHQLPDQVAIHFNYRGEADKYTEKTILYLVPASLGMLMYLVLLIIPKIDPKKKLNQMGDKYYSLRLILGVFFCILSIYFLYGSLIGELRSPKIIHSILGAFIAIAGNYFQTIRPNYFIGIRTPWTLESEYVWRQTHAVGGKLWMIGGCLMIALSFISGVPDFIALVILGIISLIPIVHSYILFRQQKESSQ